MGLGNLLWRRAFNTMESELRRRGYTTSMREDPTRDSPESRTIRVVCRDTVVDLYIRSGYWTIDTWINVAGGWHHSNVGETVQDRYRLRGGFTDLDSGTPHQIVLDTLVYNFVLPEFGPGIAPDPAASRIPGTLPGPAAQLPEQIVSEPSVQVPERPVSVPSVEAVDVDDASPGDQDGEDDWYGDDDYEDEEEEDEPPAEAGLSPKDALQNTQLVLRSSSWLQKYHDEYDVFHELPLIAAWGSSYDPAGRRADGYLIARGPRMGFFRPEELRKSPAGAPEPLVFLIADCELVRWGKPHGVSLDVPGRVPAEDNRLGLFTLQLNVPGGEELNFSIDYGQYDADGGDQVVDFMWELIVRVAAAADPIPPSFGNGQDVAQHFAARGVHNMSESMQAPARLYLDEDFLPGSVVIAGHLLGFFPKDLDENNSEQGPLMVSFDDVTEIHLTVPEGLGLLIPRGVGSDTLLNGTILGLTMFLKTKRVSLVLDFPRDNDAQQERAHVRWFIDGLLARFAKNRTT